MISELPSVNSIIIRESNIYISGTLFSDIYSGPEHRDIFIIKCDEQGNIIWNKTWDSGFLDLCRSLSVSNSELFVAGCVEPVWPELRRSLILKFDSNGTIIWSKYWDDNSTSEAYDIASDNSYIYMCGYIEKSKSPKAAYLIKSDLDGNNTNCVPVAFIDIISPNPVTQGLPLTFIGHGSDLDGRITGYKWRSDIDGNLSTNSQFIISTLTIGNHTIFFSVKDNNNSWSNDVIQILRVEPKMENQPPTAIIDTLLPNQTEIGQLVSFSGHGIDYDGIIIDYNWTSNIDGQISTNPSFITTNLSAGNHTISFSVKDNNNTWSSKVYMMLIINTRQQAKLVIEVIPEIDSNSDFIVTIKDEYGKVIQNSNVSLTKNNITILMNTTDIYGIVNFRSLNENRNTIYVISSTKDGYIDADKKNIIIKEKKIQNRTNNNIDFNLIFILLILTLIIVISIIGYSKYYKY
jgi:hypothetical protein